jgi:antitoxin (DNA-binding transcriptional repressor) of toxin-antitoxin stability system
MRAVNIAQLKSGLSGYLQEVRAGEESIIRDRNLPIAKLTPLAPGDADAVELALVAAGKLKLPEKRLNEAAFWAIGRRLRVSPRLHAAARAAISKERQERDDSVLGL